MRALPRARRAALARGHVAELKALLALALRGWRPLARRFSAAGGEIDLVVVRGAVIAFVEVKARAEAEAAILAIDAAKRERFSRAARMWVARHPWAIGRSLRADAVLVAPGRWPRHVEGIFKIERL